MISLRSFTSEDICTLRQNLYSDLSAEQIGELISEWDSKSFKSKYFEMFAIIDDGAVVGSVSVYERSKNSVSLGVEVFQKERCKGYAAQGIRLALEKARGKGYRIVWDQVCVDNTASIALHEKLGFETDSYIYKNAKNNEVLIYMLCLYP